MADISKFKIQEDPTLERMNNIIENVHFNNIDIPNFKVNVELSNYSRGYLGASGLGHECEKKLWYDFRRTKKERFDIKTIKRFQSGHFSEELMAYRLRLVPEIELHTLNSKNEQFGISAFGGHFSGHLDGAIKGLLQAPKTWHVWEHKDSEKIKEVIKLKQSTDEKEILKKWNNIYYAQAQLYMGYTEMTRHYMTISSPGGRDEISIRTDFNKKDFEAFRLKAEKIIKAEDFNSLVQMSERADFYKCKWCHYNDICHNQEIPEVNCRTCVHSTPLTDRKEAIWICEKTKETLIFSKQCLGCTEHLFNPCFLKNFGQAIEAAEDNSWIKYQSGEKIFFNCTRNSFPSVENDKNILGIFTSIKMHEQQTDILNEKIQKVIKNFNGTIETNGNFDKQYKIEALNER